MQIVWFCVPAMPVVAGHVTGPKIAGRCPRWSPVWVNPLSVRHRAELSTLP